MGFFSALASLFSSKKKVKIIIVGLDNSGKTTIMNWMKPKKKATIVTEVTPTISYNIETFQKKNFNFTMFDMSGQQKYRDLWEKVYPEVDGIIFVIDSADRVRFAVAKNELELLITHKDVKDRNVPILFLANKMDIKDSYSANDCARELSLEEITDKSWHIMSTNALLGNGIAEGLQWLIEKLEANMKNQKKK